MSHGSKTSSFGKVASPSNFKEDEIYDRIDAIVEDINVQPPIDQ